MYFPRYISLGYVCLLFSLLDRLVFYLRFTLGLKKTKQAAQYDQFVIGDRRRNCLETSGCDIVLLVLESVG
jgi:hypothetical protein